MMGHFFRQDWARSGWYGHRQAYSTQYSQAVSHIQVLARPDPA